MKNLFLFLKFCFIIQIIQAQIPPKPPVYQAQKISNSDIVIDGNLHEKVWQAAPWTDEFIDIQGNEFKKPYLNTKAKILWSDSMIYIGALMEEPHIWANIAEDEKVIFYDNDFEVFIDPNGDNHNYYEFEFNALNKKWDLFLQWPYRDTLKPDQAWNCQGLKHAVRLNGSINETHDVDSAWTIEIGIPINQLASEIKPGDVWRMNFSRVQWESEINESTYQKKNQPENNWVWSPTWKINIHRPEYWGFVNFVDQTEAIHADSFTICHRNWETRCQLMKAYERRRMIWRKHQTYDSVRHLEEGIESKEWGFRYILRKNDGQNDWLINEKGRLWKDVEKPTPKFWIWMNAGKNQSSRYWDSVFADIASLGIRGVLLQASSETIRKILPLAHQNNIQLHIWMWAMNRGDAPKEYLSVNDLGYSLADEMAYVGYYKFMCPALPEVKDFINKKVKELERIDGIDGVHLDYIRYVDVFLPKGLLPKYHLVQDDILPEFDYGYHPLMMEKFKEKYGISPKDIEDYPHDSLWQQFRMDQVSKIVNDLAWEFSSKPLQLTAAVFPDPEMSRNMVRQDWGAWKLDYYFPMVYNGFYEEGTEWIEERIRISKNYHPHQAVFCGLYLPDSQTKEQLHESIHAAFRGGASGISFFNYWSLKDYQKEAIKSLTKDMELYIPKKIRQEEF